MAHVFMLDSDTYELERLSDGTSSMIVRGSHEMPSLYQNLEQGDKLYFTQDNREGEIEALGLVSYVMISGKLTEEESYEIIIRNQDKLQLPDDQFYKWAGKPYLLMIGLAYVRPMNLNLTEPDEHLPFLIPQPQAK